MYSRDLKDGAALVQQRPEGWSGPLDLKDVQQRPERWGGPCTAETCTAETDGAALVQQRPERWGGPTAETLRMYTRGLKDGRGLVQQMERPLYSRDLKDVQ